jgi:hypothetical protein
MTPSLCTCSLSLSVCAMLQMCTRTPTYSSTTLHTLPVCVWLCVSAVCVCVCVAISGWLCSCGEALSSTCNVRPGHWSLDSSPLC